MFPSVVGGGNKLSPWKKGRTELEAKLSAKRAWRDVIGGEKKQGFTLQSIELAAVRIGNQKDL